MRNINLFSDYYELTMANSYFIEGKANKIAVFDFFFRRIPDNGGYATFVGLDQLINYISNISFSKEEINFLKKKKIFDPRFLKYLSKFRFTGDIYSFEEGTPIFPGEPVLVVKAPLIECQIIETYLLATLNHQSLIATKTARMVESAKGRPIMEFGARRAHGYDAANFGARSAYIAGCVGSSNTYTDFIYGIPALGTMSHSYVQSFNSEYESFIAYAKTYPDETVLLVDTYDTLKQGLPNAIRCAKNYLEPNGYRLKAIRIDSGDLAYLTKKCREILDENGLKDCMITVSNSLDEYIIKDLLIQGAKIDSFGIGERLITSKSESVFGGVYKLAELNNEPKMKVSNTPEKTTTPGFKQVYRFFDNNTKKAIADLVTLFDEKIDTKKTYTLFDPIYTWKKKEVSNFYVEPLLKQIFKDGKLVYKKRNIEEIKKYCNQCRMYLWDEVKRLERPHQYYVDLSEKLWNLKDNLIRKMLKK